MKILALSNYYPEHPGGIEFVALNLVKRWRRHHQVRWLACDLRGAPHAGEADDIPLPALNFTEERLGFPYPIPMGKSYSRIFEQVKWCDVAHIHDCLYPASIYAFLASRWFRKPLLVTQHVAPIPYPQAYKNILQMLAYPTIGRVVLENAEGVTFVSKRVQNWFERRMRFRREAIFIPNGVDRELFYPPTEEERKASRARLHIASDETVFLFVGRFTQKKGLHLVREIAQARPHIRWIMIGKGELDPRTWNLKNIKVISPQPQAALREYYIAADLFVLPSRGEGFPLAAQEALACGVPAAISSETADHVPGAPLIRLDVAALPNLLQTLDNLLATRELPSGLKNATIEYLKRWNWENVARQYEDAFADLIVSLP